MRGCGSLLLTALTGKAAGSRPGGPHAAAPLPARGSAPARPGASPGVQSGGRSCRRGGRGGLTGFRWGGRGRERGRGGEEGDGGRSVPKTSVAWQGREGGEQSQAWLLGRPAAATPLP